MPSIPENSKGHEITAINAEQVKANIEKLKGTSTSASGWNDNLLKLLATDDVCLLAITTLINAICNDRCSEELKQIILQCKLIALEKPNSNKPRPITIPEPIWKLACRIQLQQVKDDIAEILQPVQFGCGYKGGASHVLLTLQAAIDTCMDQIDDGILCSVDFENAFNLPDRDLMIQELFAHEELAPIFKTVLFGYGTTSSIVVIDKQGKLVRIDSAMGSRQGCIFGSLLYCIYTIKVFKEAQAAAMEVHTAKESKFQPHTASYMDDLNHVSGADEVAAFLQVIVDSKVGKINTSKSALIWIGSSAQPPEATKLKFEQLGFTFKDGGHKSMGIPLGKNNRKHSREVQKFLEDTLTNHKEMFKILNRPGEFSPFQLLTLLRVCVRPKFEYITTVIPPQETVGFAQKIDKLIRNTLFNNCILLPNERVGDNADLPKQFDAPSKQASLALKFSGLGLRDLSITSYLAYWGAIARSANAIEAITNQCEQPQSLPIIMSRDKTFFHITKKLSLPTSNERVLNVNEEKWESKPLLPDQASNISTFYAGLYLQSKPRLQKHLTAAYEAICYEQMLSKAAPTDKIRLQTLFNCREAHAYLLVDPTQPGAHSYYLRMNKAQETQALRFRLGLPVAPNLKHCFRCKANIRLPDPTHSSWSTKKECRATHHMHCKGLRSNERQQAHNKVVQLVGSWLHQAGMWHSLESKFHNGIDNKRPDLSFSLDDGRMFYGDVVITHPANPSNTKAAEHQGIFAMNYEGAQDTRALQQVARNKQNKYRNQMRARNTKLFVLAAETYGRIHSDFHKVIKIIAQRAAENNSIPYGFTQEQYQRRMIEQVSTTIQQGYGQVAIAHLNSSSYTDGKNIVMDSEQRRRRKFYSRRRCVQQRGWGRALAA